MINTYENTSQPRVASDIELETNTTETGAYDQLQFDRDNSVFKKSEQSKCLWKLLVVVVAISLTVSAILCIVTGAVVYTLVRADEEEFHTLPDATLHGGWSSWTAWGECSGNCSVGLQRRDRNCTNPYPGPGGNKCFGDSRDDRVCFLRACAVIPFDGNWSGWTQWSTCTATCNGGMMTRSRTGDSSSPSMFGKSCVGNSDENALCNTVACPRTAPAVIFSVTSPSYILVGGSETSGVPSFRRMITNIGNGFNATSGEFKCVVPGTYQFSLSFMSVLGNSYCSIQHNKQDIVYAQSKQPSSSSLTMPTTTSTYITLAVADVVNLDCNGWNNVNKDISNVFNGALVALN